MDMDLSAYAGRWVALVGGRVAGVGSTPDEARRVAQHNRGKDRFVIWFVEPDGGERLKLSPLLDRLRPFLLQQEQPIYLVGGAVRDGLLGRESHDLDFVVPRQAIKLAFKVADWLGVPAYVLDRERDTGRVVLAEEATTLDFACFRGDDLEADLRDRDFGLNAIALPATAVTTTSLIDPCNGQADLMNRRIHLTHPNALNQDPVRLLRGLRLAAKLNFTLSEETQTAVSSAVPHLYKTSGERVRDELLNLIGTAVPDQLLFQMQKMGVLTAVLPEIAALEPVQQSAPHHEPVLAHTATVLRWLLQIELLLKQPSKIIDYPELNTVQQMLAPFAEELRTHLMREVDGGVDGYTLLRLSGLFHDVGKLETQTVEGNGRIRFFGHDKVGAKIAAKRLRRLHLSNQAIKHVKFTVQNHMRPLSLLNSLAPQKKPSRRAIYRFFRDAKEAGLDVSLLALADFLATNNRLDNQRLSNQAEWEHLLAIVAELLHHYFNRHEESVAPKPLLNGHDLIQLLQLSPGPEIGRLLRLLEEAQAAGELHTKEAAIEFAYQTQQ